MIIGDIILNNNENLATLCSYISSYIPSKALINIKNVLKLFLMSKDKIELQINKKCYKYIDDLNRIGLLYLSNTIFKSMTIFMIIIMIYLIYAYLNIESNLLNIPTKRMLYHQLM